MKEIGKIYETKDYSMFKRLSNNRDVKGIQKIIKSVEKVGQVLSPILVNENNEVIDGQNRLAAMQELGLPVQYIVSSGIGIEECRALNIGQSNWTSKDFIKSFAGSGSRDYENLMTLILEYSEVFGYEGVLFMTFPKYIPINGGTNYKKDVEQGLIKLNDKLFSRAWNNMEQAIQLEYDTFKNRNELTARSYWGATSYAFSHKEVDVEELIGRLNKDPKSIVACTKPVDELVYFDKAYNKGRAATNKVFMAADFQKRLYI